MYSKSLSAQHTNFVNITFLTVSENKYKKLLAGVEFALHPQHETSCDSEIQTRKDFKNKFRKQLGSSPTTSLNSEGKEETLECLKS